MRKAKELDHRKVVWLPSATLLVLTVKERRHRPPRGWIHLDPISWGHPPGHFRYTVYPIDSCPFNRLGISGYFDLLILCGNENGSL